MTRTLALAFAATLALTACSGSDSTTSSSVPAPPSSVAVTTTQPAAASTEPTDDIAGYALLDEYCAAAAEYAAGFVSPSSGHDADDPEVAAHNKRLDALVALAPPAHAEDWYAVADVLKRLPSMDVVSGEPASVVRTMDDRINPDLIEHCGVAL